uniref:Uncharacterized protein n=1 Tax=uncultured prokaryote TaxID=198431 RepID=A0A0H5PXA2_9ZZZZ|nr:hypothetical protein [uncultured prokaryote]
MKGFLGNKSYCNSYNKIITGFKKKVKRIKKRFLKNVKIKAVGIDTIRAKSNYTNIKKLLNDKACKEIERSNHFIKCKWKGTGIFFKIYPDKTIEFYNIFQYYKSLNIENQEKLFKLILKMGIFEVDLAYDSKKDISTPLKHKSYFKDTIYYKHKNFKKIVKYDKKRKNKLKKPLFRIEFTMSLNLKKHKKNNNRRFKVSKKWDFKENKNTNGRENLDVFNNKSKKFKEHFCDFLYNFFDSGFKEYRGLKEYGYYYNLRFKKYV